MRFASEKAELLFTITTATANGHPIHHFGAFLELSKTLSELDFLYNDYRTMSYSCSMIAPEPVMPPSHNNASG